MFGARRRIYRAQVWKMHHFGTADGYEKEDGAGIHNSALPAVLRHSEKKRDLKQTPVILAQ
jgi:hypothetical protein